MYLFRARVDHHQVLNPILRNIKVKIIRRREWILMTYSKAILLFTEQMNILNSAYDTDLEGNVALQ